MNDWSTWWNSLPDEWKKILSINYVFQYWLNQQMQEDILSIGTNPFKNYFFKTGKEFTSIEIDELKLKKIKDLNMIYMADCNISTIEPLESLHNLKLLDGCFNAITEIKVFRNLINLKKVYLEKNAIDDLEPLRNCRRLEHLVVRENNITEIKAIEELTDLNFLDISNNEINDISSIRHLKNLQEFQCSLNKIENADVIAELKDLVTLDISSNALSQVQFLFQLPKLKFVDLSYNPVKFDSYPWKELTDAGTTVEFIENQD